MGSISQAQGISLPAHVISWNLIKIQECSDKFELPFLLF